MVSRNSVCICGSFKRPIRTANYWLPPAKFVHEEGGRVGRAINSMVSDGSIITDNVGKYAPNPWGMQDMHGNVSEWTRSTYRPYPYDVADGRDEPTPDGRKVVRGGSFYDRPKRGRSAFRLDYPSWQAVYNVGFRVVCQATPGGLAAKVARAAK